jgi:ubiquinone/menaquinone biosynthesis C-methylase UbiE
MNKKLWKGSDYLDRNPKTGAEQDALYLGYFGLTRTTMNERFLKDIPKDTSILEVGCGSGCELDLLRGMGFTNLKGVDINPKAVEFCRGKGLDVVVADAEALPFGDSSFDLVMTNGLLIHIPLEKLEKAMDEIVRVSREYVLGFEYWRYRFTMVPYRGRDDQMWAGPYLKAYMARPLEKVDSEKYRYSNGKCDEMFLLRKRC